MLRTLGGRTVAHEVHQVAQANERHTEIERHALMRVEGNANARGQTGCKRNNRHPGVERRAINQILQLPAFTQVVAPEVKLLSAIAIQTTTTAKPEIETSTK